MKVLLAALGGSPRDAATLDCAGALARRFGSHVIACHVRPDAAAMVPMMGGEASGALVAEFMRIAEEEAASQARRAREHFDGWSATCGLAARSDPGGEGASIEWRDVSGFSSEALPTLGHFADLLVTARPEPNSSGIQAATIEAALFGSGRPVLLAPAAAATPVGESVAIAWNGSAEATRAVAAALPILRGARKVSVIALPRGDEGEEGWDPLAAYLRWHGIVAVAAAAPAVGLDTGEALEEAARASGADLLVMGAYGHSRLREMVFGGATRHAVETATLATLLAH